MQTYSKQITIFSIALIISALVLGYFYSSSKKVVRVVSVKGSAEKIVEADFASWQMKFSFASNNLDEARTKIEADHAAILKFLEKYGIDKSEVEQVSFDVTDTAANQYQTQPVQNRYILSKFLLVRTNKIDEVQKASENVGELVKENIIISGDVYSTGVSYYFTKLNDIKNDMLADATKNARTAAMQFATDSNSKLGNIKYASQGTFEIQSLGADYTISETKFRKKKVRVVSSVEFFLD